MFLVRIVSNAHKRCGARLLAYLGSAEVCGTSAAPAVLGKAIAKRMMSSAAGSFHCCCANQWLNSLRNKADDMLAMPPARPDLRVCLNIVCQCCCC